MTAADQIATCALEHYEKRLSSKGKPKQGTEWTVYAAIVAKQAVSTTSAGESQASAPRRSHRHFVVSSATGTKCTANRNMGCILHDGHAEVLARRGLVRVLLLEIRRKMNGGEGVAGITKNDNDLLQAVKTDSGKFQLRAGLSMHLYVSDSPCGDASIYRIDESDMDGMENDGMLYTGAKVVVSHETGVDAADCGGDDKLLGITQVAREDRQMLGRLRTKSGRSNLPASMRSNSMSCSDKILKWSILGLQGGLLSNLVVQPIRFASIVISRDPRLPKGAETSAGKDGGGQYLALKRAIPDRLRSVLTNVLGDRSELNLFGLQSFAETTLTVHIVDQLFASGKAAMSHNGRAKERAPRGEPECQNPKKRKLGGNDTVTRTDVTSPCGFSLNWQMTEQHPTEMVVGIRGIRQGKKPKRSEDYRKLSSRLCRANILKLRQTLPTADRGKGGDDRDSPADTTLRTYQEIKSTECDADWAKLKSTIFARGPMAGWLKGTESGDFSASQDR